MFPAATAVTVARNVARRGVFSHFCLCLQVLLSLATFSHVQSRSAVTEARRRATVCHGWFYVSSRPSTFYWDLSRFVAMRSSSATSIKCCQSFLRWNVGDEWCLSPNMPTVYRWGPQSCCNRNIMHPWSKTSLHVMAMKKPTSYLYNC